MKFLLMIIGFSLLYAPVPGAEGSDITSLLLTMFMSDRPGRYIPDLDDCSGLVFRDINGDYLPDIYMVRFRKLNKLLINKGGYRRLQDVTESIGLEGMIQGGQGYYISSDKQRQYGTRSAIVADMDNDGFCEILITGWNIPTLFFKGEDKFHFTNISDRLDIFPPIEANACVTADINQDGYLDIFISDREYGNRMLLNLNDCTFQDVTQTCGLSSYAASQSAAFCDLDKDGDQDLYICTWNAPDLFYQNRGDGSFNLIPLDIKSCRDSINSNSISIADIDNNGMFDLFITSESGQNFLYLNQTLAGDTLFHFIDFTHSAGLSDSLAGYGSLISDLNNDGLPDIFIANEGDNTLYINQGKTCFQKHIIKAGTRIGYSTAAAAADFDLDGDMDIIVGNRNIPSQFYLNPVNNNSYINLILHGILSNRDAIGARIEIFPTGFNGEKEKILGMQMIDGGSGYLSMNDPLAHFGLAEKNTHIDAVINYPSGKVVVEENLVSGTTHHLYEYPKFTRTVVRSYQHIRRLMRQSIFWYQVLLVFLFIFLILLFIRLGLRRYRWNPATTSIYLAAFFFIALTATIIFQSLATLNLFLIIDSFTIVFVILFISTSERIYRIRRSREQYRTVLIQLGNQIINIRKEEELLETVVQNLQQNTEFTSCAALIYSKEKNKMVQIVSRGTPIKLNAINKNLNKQNLESDFIKNEYIFYNDRSALSVLFKLLSAQIILPIQRDGNLFGLLSMGGKFSVPKIKSLDLDLYLSLAKQMAIALENIAYIRQSNEMIKKITAAQLREKYLRELEESNANLDVKNRELQKLYNELKNTQTQLIHSEKMASLGQLVAGISHELNNPISFIYANVTQLKSYNQKIEDFLKTLHNSDKTVKEGEQLIHDLLPDLKGLIEDTIHGSRIIKELVDNLRKFSHLDQAAWKKSNIHEGIETSLMILKPQLKDRITIHKEYRAGGIIECNIGQLNQVFLNCLANAAQAIPDKGNIRITTREEKKKVVIEITDDGIGMTEEVMKKIFDPFFTTKDVGRGTGLGMSISYSIIKNHGGKIEVASEAGRGSAFKIILPIGKEDEKR
jgi:signal transduction histidine kinase